MPSAENTQEIYSSYLESAEHCISQFESDQGRSQDSVNGGAQLGAVTRPYIR